MKQHAPALIMATAAAIKDHFIPKDKNATAFSFHFTIPPSSNYKATYDKNENGEWTLKSYEADLGRS